MTERLNDMTERSDCTSFHRRSPSAADDWKGMLDSSSLNWIDPNYWTRCSKFVLTDPELQTELKLEAEFVSHPDSLARRPIDPTMGNSLGSYSYPGIRHKYQVEASPGYEMMTSARPNSDGGRVKAREVTVAPNVWLERRNLHQSRHWSRQSNRSSCRSNVHRSCLWSYVWNSRRGYQISQQSFRKPGSGRRCYVCRSSWTKCSDSSEVWIRVQC